MKNRLIYVVLGFVLLFLLILYPETATDSAKKGILVCGKIIIPSLYPVNFCVIFIMKLLNGGENKSGRLRRILLFIFSVLGGYPTGAKLIEEEYKSGALSKKSARIMQNYMINGGIGFIISTVGFGIFGRKTLGYILFSAHIIPSVILGLVSSAFIKDDAVKVKNCEKISITDSFVLSASEAANTLLSICSFVIFFAVVNGFLMKSEVLKPLCYLTEITSALKLTKNIYLCAFLLGFGGISVLCQVAAVSKNVGISIKNILVSRIVCGGLSSLILYLLLRIFNINIAVFSNNMRIIGETITDKPSVTVSLTLMIIILIISLEGRRN